MQVYDDFLLMYPMCTISEDQFQQTFEDTLNSLRRFLNVENEGKEFPKGDKGDVELLLAVNAKCSTARGVKASKPVFLIREV